MPGVHRTVGSVRTKIAFQFRNMVPCNMPPYIVALYALFQFHQEVSTS